MRPCWKPVLLCAVVLLGSTAPTGSFPIPTNVDVPAVADAPEPVDTPTPADADSQDSLTIGRATRDVALEERRWQGLLARLNGVSALPRIDLRITSSTAGLLWDPWDDKTHVFVGDPFVAASLIREIAAIPLFVIDELEPSSQRAVIVVRKPDGDLHPGDLLGRSLAFSRHGSSLAHLLPHSTLLRRGLAVAERPGDQEIATDQVAFFHLHDDRSPLMWLYRSSLGARAAAVSMQDFRAIERRRPGLFQPVLVSPPIPIAVAIASPGVDAAMRSLLIEHLEDARQELFEALGIVHGSRARLRAVDDADPEIVDLLQWLHLVEAAANVR